MNPAGDSPTLVYDGSFAGFLCAAAEAVGSSRKGRALPTIAREEIRPGLFDEGLAVRTDEARAARIWERLKRRAGGEALEECFAAFCSDRGGIEDALARVLDRLSREGAAVLNDLGDPACLLVMEAARRSQCQAHKLSGLVRFAQLADGSWYAAIEPDCDLLPLLGEHFSSRYADMAFVVHDRRRAKALLHEPGHPWRLVAGFGLGQEGSPPFSEAETAVREGWRRYFKAVAIAERRNPRLQASHMPKKYWSLLPEMEDPAAEP